VFIELTGTFRRYVAPLMRSATVGTPDPEVLRAAEVTGAAVQAILATAGDGVPSRHVAQAAMSVLREGLDGRAFHNIIGYPVGIAYPPSWVENLGCSITVNSDFVLRKGMVFHLPMSLRKPGSWAIGLSQTIVVGENGATPLGSTEAALRRIGE
jgi:Xaa-Pro dipeptidase